MITRIIPVLIIMTLIFSGCGKAKQKPQAEEISPMPALIAELETLMSEDKAEEAVARLDKAMTEEQFQENKPQLFSMILSVLLQQQQIDHAVSRHLTMLQTEPSLACNTFIQMQQGLMANNADSIVLLDWTSGLLRGCINGETRSGIYILRSAVLSNEGKDENILDIIDACAKELALPLRINTYEVILNALMAQSKLETAEQIIKRIEDLNKEADPGLAQLTNVSRLTLLIASSDWPNFMNFYSERLGRLDDRNAGKIIRSAFSQLKNSPLMAEQICKIAVGARKPDESSFFTAARNWLDLTAEHNPGQIPECVRALRTAGMNDSKLQSVIHGPFYAVLKSAHKDQLKEMIDLLQDIRTGMSEKDNPEYVNNMILDGHFTLQDYDSAISMIEKGLGGKDAAWRKSAAAKLKAHKAMDAGKPDEAITHFRDFMNAIAESMEPERDPSTGMLYTKLWCLGRNAKRIGDLYAQQQLLQPSLQAYAEAVDNFEQALKDFQPDSPEYKAISQEKDAVPVP